ncbi:MAG: circadian clock KaiB family protein [Xenococcaceae cyanobacterium MO_188.B19]|nr:circadian clock KaiB family protein [Xenococcaceae cyanobacterium MO_188.B19]
MNHQEDNSLDNPSKNLDKYVFRLYIADSSMQSVSAVRQMQKLCKKYLPERYELEIIDIYRHPERLEADQIFASPTLVKELPLPLQRLIGDLSDAEKVKISLNI